MNQQNWQTGQIYHGFKLASCREVAEARAVARLFHHEKSGARLLHLKCDDPENAFAAGFRTPPPDDTGLPHILEHTVLCGSEKYPVKDPFIALLQTSLATFLNAMTYPDRTIYPCASMNERDFFNLMSVYADAVFKPRILAEHFQQEGHHLTLEKLDDLNSPLNISGVVYNEMKGAYSGLDGTMWRYAEKLLLPGNAYGRDSGGDPDKIPGLTYEQFTDFYQRYYHPANSYIIIYGNIATEKHLRFLDEEYFSKYERLAIDTAIKAQPRWQKPRQKTIPYAAGPTDNPAKKSALLLGWFMNQQTDAPTTLALKLLANYLLAHAASPLRRALTEARLGEEIIDAGYDNTCRDTGFWVGLKGCDAAVADKFVALVRQTLEEQASGGLQQEALLAALHQLELAAHKIEAQYPVHLVAQVYCSWLYDGDPLEYLQTGEKLAALREKILADKDYVPGLIKTWFLDNPHRLTLTFVPDCELATKEAAAFRQKMAAQKSEMSQAEIAAVAAAARELAARQSAPNPPEALATLPRLGLQDVSPEPLEFACRQAKAAGRPVAAVELFSGGLDYITLGINVADFADEQLRYLPVFAEVFDKLGAGGLDYAAAAARDAACCGGFSARATVGGAVEDFNLYTPTLRLGATALERNTDKMLAALGERLLTLDFTDHERLRDIILEARTGMRSAVVHSGHHFAATCAAAALSLPGAIDERFGGLSLLRLLDELADNFDGEKLAVKLQAIAAQLQNRERYSAAVLGGGNGKMTRWLEDFWQPLNATPLAAPPARQLPEAPRLQGLATPSAVSFVARALPGVASAHPLAPALNVLGNSLQFGYLWEEVRVRRGAYGCMAKNQTAAGYFSFASYRDPQINSTREVYDQAASYVKEKLDLSPEALTQAIIGAFKQIDTPWRPGMALQAALGRLFNGSTLAHRQMFRQRLLNLTKDDILAAAEFLTPQEKMAECVLASEEALGAAALAEMVTETV